MQLVGIQIYNTNTIIINIIVVLTGSKLCFTTNRLPQTATDIVVDV